MSDDGERGQARAQAREMVRTQIAARGIHDPRVLAAIEAVPRDRFVPPRLRALAYSDQALPIGWDATISQPYIVALMSELAAVEPGDAVLEIGTGSGYQAAVLAELGAAVHSIERVDALASRAREALTTLGYCSDAGGDAGGAPRGRAGSVQLRHGDGFAGWPEAAPFRVILLTAAPAEIPETLLDQLAVGGRLIAPVGGGWPQSLVAIERRADGLHRREITSVVFVPMRPGTA